MKVLKVTFDGGYTLYFKDQEGRAAIIKVEPEAKQYTVISAKVNRFIKKVVCGYSGKPLYQCGNDIVDLGLGVETNSIFSYLFHRSGTSELAKIKLEDRVVYQTDGDGVIRLLKGLGEYDEVTGYVASVLDSIIYYDLNCGGVGHLVSLLKVIENTVNRGLYETEDF